MVVVFSVNGALASYAVEFITPSHVIATQVRGDKRKDIPEKLELFKENGVWISSSDADSIKNSIIHALGESGELELGKEA
jgi:hypothetical protein